MTRSLRLLPFTMLIAFLLLGLKVGEAVRDGRMLALSFTQEAHAQAAAPSEGKAPDAKTEAKPEEGKPADAKTAEGKATDNKEAASPGGPNVTPPSTDDNGDDAEEAPKRQFSQVEIDILQSLAKRRDELDDREKQIGLKQNMLIATEQRINDKIDNLEKMKKEIEALLAQYNEQEDTKIRSLVKIYENMKPKDASRIFEELDMPILLIVVDRMSERKVAPILAGMTPEKAKNLTVQLAEQHKLQKPRANTVQTPAATPNSADSSAQDNAAAPVTPAPTAR